MLPPTIDTGLTPSTVVVEKAWASGWIYGLVPPSTLETKSKCPSGAAKVETQHSFLDTLVERFAMRSIVRLSSVRDGIPVYIIQ